MPKIVELVQDRNLICHDFGGYFLSLDAVPILRTRLTPEPHIALPNNEQYSLLHAELFSLQNLLQSDPWARTTNYFVNSSGGLVQSRYNEIEGRAVPPQVVFRVPDECGGGDAMRRISGDYNYSFRFISEKFCVLCDGIRRVFLLDTGDRLRTTEWNLVTSTVISNSNAEGGAIEERNFMLYDCRLDIIQEQKQISLALGRVQRVDDEAAEVSGHFLHIHWAQWRQVNNVWNFSILETLVGKGSLYYCAFEPRAESLVISSNRDYKFQRENDVQNGTEEKLENPQDCQDEADVEVFSFTWSQSDEDVVILFDPREDRKGTDYIIESLTNKLTVKCKDEILLDSNLFTNVEQDLTTWIIENNSLQITLCKKSPAAWTKLLADGAGPKETLENGSEIYMPVDPQPIANLETPIEDCDFPMNTIDDEIKIVRFHLPTKCNTHTVLLGSTPPLFATNLRPGFPLALATRQDVDASLWLQQYNPNKPTEWSLRHEGNLHAFGYVQASKLQKKFTDCAPDLSYAIICEARRHIFLFKSNNDGANGLRNRNGPKVLVGTSKLITLDGVGEVLGMTTAPNLVTLLTEKYILHLQIL